MASPKRLRAIVRELAKSCAGPDCPLPGRPPTTDPFELVLWENVAYLADDRRRAAAFEVLRERVGLKPRELLAASFATLLACTRLGGMHPERRVELLRDIARLCADDFGGDLARVLALPPRAAAKALMRFPGIGAPGAEKILLFAGGPTQGLPLESNGLRVLLRLGYGAESKSYAASYRSVQAEVASELAADRDWLVRAHLLLRAHGQDVCRRGAPRCELCPLAAGCAHYLRQG